MTEEQRNLTPEQDKAIERIQFAGVVVLVITVIAINALSRADVLDRWKLLLIGFSVMVVLVLIAGRVVSRIEQRPYGQFMIDLSRQVARDLKGAPARIGRRAADAFARLTSR